MDAPAGCQSRDAARDHEIGERVVIGDRAQKIRRCLQRKNARTFSKSRRRKKMRAFGMTAS
jgi:hypothetical protein